MSTKQQAEKEWRRQRCNFIEEFTPVGLCISGHRPAEIKFHLAVGWFNPLFLMSEVRTLPNSRIGLRKRQLKFGVCQRHLFGIHRRETTCGRLRSVNAHDEWERFKFSRIGNSASFPKLLLRLWEPMKKCKRKRKQQGMSKNWSCSWQWRSSKITDTLTSGPMVSYHILLKKRHSTGRPFARIQKSRKRK